MSKISSYIDVSHFVTVIITAVGTWILGFPKRRKAKAAQEKAEAETKLAQAAQGKAEAALLLAKRRGAGPLLVPDDTMFHGIYEATGPKIQMWFCGNQNVLCWSLGEVVDLPDKTPVIFLVQNIGKAAPQYSLDFEGGPIELKKEPEMDSAHGFYFLKYAFHAEMHGKAQTLRLKFISENGFEDTHTYELVHGHRMLKRIDPPQI